GGGGVAILHQVVLTLGAVGVSGEAAGLPQGGKCLAAARQQLVNVGLVAGVPDDGVLGAVEYAVKRQRQLHHAQVGREVAAGLGDLLDQEGADLCGQLFELRGVQGPQVRRGLNGLEHRSSYRNERSRRKFRSISTAGETRFPPCPLPQSGAWKSLGSNNS